MRHLYWIANVLIVGKLSFLSLPANGLAFIQRAHKRVFAEPFSPTNLASKRSRVDSIFDTVSYFFVLYGLNTHFGYFKACPFSHKSAKKALKSGFLLWQEFFYTFVSQLICQLIPGVAVVAPYPMPRNFMIWKQPVQFLP